MIPHGVEVFVGVESIDLRWGFDRLAGLVSERLGRTARSGALFVFRGRRNHAIKVLFFDGTGLCLFYKRLDRGTFRWPEALAPEATSVTMDERALEALLDGIDVETPARRARKERAH
jgi:transposase